MDDFKQKLKEIREKLLQEEKKSNELSSKEVKISEEDKENTQTEEELFKKAMEGVKKITGKNKVPRIKTTDPPPIYNEDDEIVNTLSMIVEGGIEFKINDTIEYIEGYNVRDYDLKEIRKLKRGEIAYEASLDLHGKKKEEAKQLVKNFIDQSRKYGNRCVLIVHGRGIHSKDNIPILKDSLKIWLSNNSIGKHILAFCSATPKDGGTGAIYVLLRK